MSYEKQTWVDNVSPLNAERMNHIEEGVSALSEEIEGLKNEDLVTYSGDVVSFAADEGAIISVDGEATGEVTLVRHGKNFMRAYTGKTVTSGVSITPNEDGTVHIVGTNTGGKQINAGIITDTAGVYFPAGTYMISASIPHEDITCKVTFVESGVGMSATYAKPKVKLEASAGGPIKVYAYIPDGVTVDGDLKIQIERVESVEEWTDFEPPMCTETVVTLPTSVSALDGKNILYTTTGDILTVKAPKPESEDELAFDASNYDLPILTLDGNCKGMTKDDYVTLAFSYQGMSGNIDVKKQGSSSVQTGAEIGAGFDNDVGGLFNFTLKFPEAFEAKEGWGAHNKYVFKADAIDHSHIRNVGGAKLWGQVVASRASTHEALAAAPNKGAIDGFPCVIVLNGKFYAIGMITIPKDDWMVGMGSGTQEALLCAGGTSNCLMQGEVTVAEAGADFDLEYVTDEDNAGWVQTSLNTLVNACLNSDGTDLDTTVAQYLDWDSAIDLYIFIRLFGGYDLIIKNHTLATYDGVKWYFGAYDMDCLWGNMHTGKEFLPANTYRVANYKLTQHRVWKLVNDYKLDAFKARYAELRANVLSEANVETTLLNLAAGIPAAVLDANTKRWPKLRSTAVNNLAQILNWYRMRCQIVDKEVEAL